MRAAVFLWTMLRLTALSSAENASERDVLVGDLRAFLTTMRSNERVLVFCFVRARSWRNFLDACFVIGMKGSIP